MKRLFKRLLLVILMTSCSKDPGSEGPNPADGEGLVKLEIASEHSVQLKSTSLPEAGDDYLVVVKDNQQKIAKDGTYAEFKIPFALITARGYTITAESITESVALSARENRGDARYAGAAGFDVVRGEEAAVSLICSMANARVSVGYTDNFKAHFSDYSVSIKETSDPSRSLSFDKNAIITNEATWGYFNIDSNPEIEISITSTRNDGVVKIFSQRSTIEAKNWVKLNFNVMITEGEASVDITVDKTITPVDSSLELDPFSNMTLTIPTQLNAEPRIWSKHIFITTPLTVDNIVTEESKEAILENVVYEASSDGANWIASSKVNGEHKISGLTPGAVYTLRARYFSVISGNTQTFTTEPGTQLENNGFENWSYDNIKKTYLNSNYVTLDYPNANKGTGIWSTANAKSASGASGGSSGWFANMVTFWRWYSGTKKTSDRSIGNLAAQISTMGFYTKEVDGDWNHNETYSYGLGDRRVDIGLLFTGLTPELGVAHASRPLSISFDYKYSPYSKDGTGDNCIAYAKIYNAARNEIATTINFTSPNPDLPDYTKQTLDFTYSSLDTKAAFITVYFQSGVKTDYSNNTRLIQGSYGSSPRSYNTIVGSVLKVDNVILNY